MGRGGGERKVEKGGGVEEKYNNEFLLCRLKKNGNSDGVIKKGNSGRTTSQAGIS